MKIRFGVRLTLYTEFDEIKEYAREAERLDYDTLWINDHLLPISGSTHKPLLECWTTLTSLACNTERINLGTLVLNNSFRRPQLLAKMISTLSVISKGRIEIGIGAGWYEREYKAFGIPFNNLKERIAMLEESIMIMRELWNGEATFNGKFYNVNKAVCIPKPLKPLPLLIGGNSKSMISIMAKYADKANFLIVTREEFAQKCKLLDELSKRTIPKSLFCEAMVLNSENDARDEIKRRLDRDIKFKDYTERSIIGTNEYCIERIKGYVNAGCEEFMFALPMNKEQLSKFSDSVISCL